MRDPLQSDLPSLPAPPIGELFPTRPMESWWEKFQYDLYDWNDAEFKKKNRGKYAYMPIRLTRGFFMMVSRRDYKRMTQYPDGKPKKFYAAIHRDRETGEILKVYAARRGRRKYNEPAYVLAHREIKNVLRKAGEVDHINTRGLDNRGPNLDDGNANRHNNVPKRRKHHGLPIGVEPKKNGRFGGIRVVRLSKKEIKIIRSEETWVTPELAAKWYQDELEKLHNRTSWAHKPRSVNFARFPPRLEEEPETPAQKQNGRVLEEAIPF